jgi:hypothetical protein
MAAPSGVCADETEQQKLTARMIAARNPARIVLLTKRVTIDQNARGGILIRALPYGYMAARVVF